jgi:alpha-mannosidase
LLVRTDVRAPRVVADAAFGPVERRPPDVPLEARAMEHPDATAPLHRYVSCFDGSGGATLFGDGLTEYEADVGGTLAVTLTRSVGELSRRDLPERPGHAGYPVATPLAQGRGSFEASFAFFLHGPRSAATVDRIERVADDALLPLEGHPWRTAVDPPAAVEGVTLEGVGLACSAVKESEDGGWLVLRCVNLLDAPAAGAWRLEGITEARVARLDETPLASIAVQGGTVRFEAPARGIVTVLVR